MVAIRSGNEISQRWENNAGNRQNYESGVENPISDWKDETSGSTERWNDAVRQAADRDALNAGIQDVGTGDWQEKALEVGAGRISQGVSANVDKYQNRFERYRQVIESTDLPAKGPSGDVDTNIERARVMAQALADEKRGQ